MPWTLRSKRPCLLGFFLDVLAIFFLEFFLVKVDLKQFIRSFKFRLCQRF